jgi:hydrophobe/amphiphile efflux-1 (HAE1) family protein
MFLSDVSIKRPVFTAMVMVGLMTLGLLATRNIGVDLFPDVSFPVLTVTTIYPGAGPEEIEQQVTKRIEEAVSAVNGVDKVMSYSRDSVSQVIVQFKLEADVKTANSDVRDKVAAARGQLPTGIREPVIQRFDPTASAILTYTVASSRNSAETRRIAEDKIKPVLEAIDGVASVSVVGGLEREVHVYVDPQRLDELGLSLGQVAQQVGMEGFDLPGGRITSGGSELTIKTEGRYRSLDELKDLVVGTVVTGGQIKLKDVARVEDGFKEVRTATRLDGKDAVTLQIQKAGGTNTVAIADQVYKAIAKLEQSLPKDVRLNKAIDTSEFIRKNIHDVREDIVFGGLMAVLVIFLFMLDWRSTFISSLSLPTSVVTTFLAMWWMGFTFNMMSLLALSLSIGLLIDDAVVVRENIFRHMEMGKDPITAAREGTNEIGLAVMATTFTIVAVFVPVAFMGGMVGQFFRQFGLTVAAAVLVSLFVSFTLDPMMSARVMKPIEKGHHEALKRHRIYGPIVRFYDGLDDYYRSVLQWALDNRKKVIFGTALVFLGTMGLTKYMGKEFVAPEDRGEFRVMLELPAGTSFAKTQETVGEIEQVVKAANKEVRSIFSTVGPNEEANKAELRVYTSRVLERSIPIAAIKDDVRAALATVPGLQSSVVDLGIVDGPVEYPITLFVRGDDYEKLQEIARQALKAVKETRGTADADMTFRSGKPETSVRVDRARAADLGLSTATLAQTVRLAVEGDSSAKFRDGDRDYDVRVQLAPEDRGDTRALEDLSVIATGRRMGGNPFMPVLPKLVRLGEVARVVQSTGPATIERQNRQRQIIINANLAGRSLGDVVADLEPKLAAIEKPAGYTFVFGGQTERMQDTFSNMLIALAVAVLFIYFVLASQFESFIHPFTIMVALPLALVGALLALFLSNTALGMPAMIGIILLMGLVTKNAILLVDYTNELRGQGMRMKDALLKAGPTRLRPILMTSAAMVLGMVPGAVARGEGSEFKAPMAIAVIGGVIASTVLTLLVVPIVYTWFDRFTLNREREPEPAKAPEPPRRESQHAPSPAIAFEAAPTEGA